MFKSLWETAARMIALLVSLKTDKRIPEVDTSVKVEGTIETPEVTIKIDTEATPPVEITSTFRIKNIVNELPKGPGKYPVRDKSVINKVVVHHAASDGVPKGFANYHIKSRGWPGIGYHFVISKDGIIWQTNFLTTVSNHVDNNNTRSVGICLVGHFDNELPSAVQIDALRWLIGALKEILPPFEVRSHNEFSSKSCPGKNMSEIMKELQKV